MAEAEWYQIQTYGFHAIRSILAIQQPPLIYTHGATDIGVTDLVLRREDPPLLCTAQFRTRGVTAGPLNKPSQTFGRK